MPLFDVAVIEHAKPAKDDEDQELERLVFGPKTVVATDEQNAAINLMLDKGDEFKDINRSRMEVLVRPFG